MAQRVLAGAPASPGLVLGAARLLDAPPLDCGAEPVPPELRSAEVERALGALAAAGREIEALASRLRGEGLEDDAEVVETGALMAADPELAHTVRSAIEERGVPAAAAIASGAAVAAELIASVPDPSLAARADDVLSLGRRAARIAVAGAERTPEAVSNAAEVVLVARDLGPADVSELGAEVLGVALAAGGVTAHAAIVARSRGLPMVVGLGDEALDLSEGEPVVVDGIDGVVVRDPAPDIAKRARAATSARMAARLAARETRDLPAVTTDGCRVAVLVNAAGAAEVTAGLEAGAEGVGLLRTELSFLDAANWPPEEDHHRALAPVIQAAGARTVVVRVLDFGGDKTPPFLSGDPRRGIELLRSAPAALDAQLRAILSVRAAADVRVMVPLVRDVGDLLFVRERLRAAAAATGAAVPALGAMIETREGASAASAIASEADFVSIGTNDLSCAALGLERYSATEGPAHHPQVLELLAQTVMGARQAGVPVEVCGEAASHPVTVPILVGLGVDELSVGAARVGIVRSWIRALAAGDARAVTDRALGATSTAEVEAAVSSLTRALELLEGDDAAGQGVEGRGRVAALGAQR